ncbi:cystatin-A-like [Stylophora pistillata]|uniref:Leukocyte cysteine proteinase inhibitor 1 n=1 Tax=Stylophora pistillata TaxID=50429 RepID=A0A2B4SYM7_STYPI|nr:cystatin-A-like [Stylophora pistillata]XP_022796846.1 cystatin-A-like [Stylophora pistillata]PFX33668.1 Leukocyte cysteine proteinase inhibitor 1 [Stylophora pistillata]
MAALVGGFSKEMKATEEVQKIVDEVRSQAEAMAGKSFKEFKAISYRSQVVQGMNYLVKVQVGDSSYVHLRIHQSLPQDGSKIELIAIRTGLSEDDSLDDFKADGKN